MKKSDLDSGMVVVLENGVTYMVILNKEHKGTLSNKDGFMYLSEYNEDLTRVFFGSSDYSVKKVYKPKKAHSIHVGYFKEYLNTWFELVWERTEDKYKDLKVGDICEVWDASEETYLCYYNGDGIFVNDKYNLGTSDGWYYEAWENFRLIKRASDIND